MNIVALTDRDRELLSTLTTAVRAFTVTQVARTWWSTARPQTARTRLAQLASGGYLELDRHPVGALLPLSTPLVTWQPHSEIPDLTVVAASVRSRWHQPPRTPLCVSATRRSAAILGGRGGRPPRPSEWTHDLHLAEVYLRLRSVSPARARTWRHEDLESHAAAERAGAKLPDAVVVDEQRPTAIELVGASYSAEKLLEFHHYCAALGMGYELW